MIAKKRPSQFDDRVGPLGLCAVVVTALVAILLVSLVDFYDYMNEPVGPPPPPTGLGAGMMQVPAANAVAGLLNLAVGGRPEAA
jgi:hypothetical protein